MGDVHFDTHSQSANKKARSNLVRSQQSTTSVCVKVYVPKTHPIGTFADLNARASFVPDDTPIASVADLNGVSGGRII